MAGDENGKKRFGRIPFGKGRKVDDVVDENAATTEVTAISAGGARKKPNEMLSSTVNESTPAAAREACSKNELFFIRRSNGQRVSAIIVLDVDQIGGLGVKDSRNEAKGSIVTLIKHNHIQALVNQEMLAAEQLGFIPDADTIERMDEFNLLVKATYRWALVPLDGVSEGVLEVDQTDVEVDFPTIQSILREEQAVVSVLHEAGVLTEADEAADSVEAESMDYDFEGVDAPGPVSSEQKNFSSLAPQEDTTNPFVAGGDDPQEVIHQTAAASSAGATAMSAPHVEEVLDDDADAESARLEAEAQAAAEAAALGEESSEPGWDDEDSAGWDDAEETDPDDSEELESSEDQDGFSWADDESDLEEDSLQTEDSEEPGEIEPVVETLANGQTWVENVDAAVSGEESRTRLRQRFLIGDLALQAHSDDFESYFFSEPFQVESPTGQGEEVPQWLLDQAEVLAEVANQELRQLHGEHLENLRRTYIGSVNEVIQGILPRYDIHGEGNVWSATYTEITDRHREKEEEGNARVKERVREIEDSYQERAEVNAKAAAELARSQYLTRTGIERQNRIAAAQQEIKAEASSWFENQVSELNRRRQSDAQVDFDQSQQEIRKALEEVRAEQVAVEQQVVQSFRGQVQEFIDNHRKAAMDHVAAQLEAERRSGATAELIQKHDAEIARITGDYEKKVVELRQEAEQARSVSSASTEELEAKWKAALLAETERADASAREVAELHERLSRDESDISARVSREVEQYRLKAEQHEAEMIQQANLQTSTNRMLSLLLVALFVVALVLGVVLGQFAPEIF